MKKAAIYTRVSTNHQIDKDSLPFQKSELINYCKYALGIDDYIVFEDAGYSGKNTERPGFQKMMSMVRKNEVSHVVVWKLDRVSRNLLDFAEMYEEMKKYEITFVSRNEQFDTSSAMGEAMLKIILIFAELERKIAAERVYSIMLSRANDGKWNGANVPMGYSWDDDKKFPVPDNEEAEIVRFIFNEYLSAGSAVAVANKLADKQFKTKRGGLWGSKGVCDIIRNPFYKGTYRYNYRESARGKVKKESEWIVIDDNHEGIITSELWESCNDLMDRNAERNSTAYRNNTHIHIFSGIMKCADCGSVMIANLDTARKDGYAPSRYICRSKSIGSGCKAPIISEITLGPFVMNYMGNLLEAFKASDSFNFPLDLQNRLLTGTTFESVESISKGLPELWKLIRATSNQDMLAEMSNSNVKKAPQERNTADKDITKYKRALERLEDLYLFDDSAMSEKDYLLKKKKLEASLDEAMSKLKVLGPSHNEQNDVSLFARAASFLIATEIHENQYIDYKTMDTKLNKPLMREFVINSIERMLIKDGKVLEIFFKNGLSHRFEYK